MGLVEQSILRPAEARVIPYGVNTAIYHPGDRAAARAELGLPADAFIAMAIAFRAVASNPYKDVTTIVRAVEAARSRQGGKPLHLICVGKSDEGSGELDHYTGYISDPRRLALYYRAADVLLHAANADNYPCVIQEALACGTPVIATAVGGIPEQLRPGATGVLVPRGDAAAMADAIQALIDSPEQLGALQQTTASAPWPYPLEQQTAQYLEWFELLGAMDQREHESYVR
jgi:glycosyltransferase involved in cell wall biosynthesis